MPCSSPHLGVVLGALVLVAHEHGDGCAGGVVIHQPRQHLARVKLVTRCGDAALPRTPSIQLELNPTVAPRTLRQRVASLWDQAETLTVPLLASVCAWAAGDSRSIGAHTPISNHGVSPLPVRGERQSGRMSVRTGSKSTDLDLLLCELHAWWHAIDHAAHPAAVRLAEGGDAEQGAERIGARRARCTVPSHTPRQASVELLMRRARLGPHSTPLRVGEVSICYCPHQRPGRSACLPGQARGI